MSEQPTPKPPKGSAQEGQQALIDEIIDRATAFGAILENIEFIVGDNGIEGRIKDVSKPFNLTLPEAALFKVGDIDLTLESPAPIPGRMDEDKATLAALCCNWIFSSQNRAEKPRLIRALQESGQNLQQIGLWRYSNFDGTTLEVNEMISEAYSISYRWPEGTQSAHMPLMKWLNHDNNGQPFRFLVNGLSMVGTSSTPFLNAHYGNYDPIQLLMSYQFTIPSPFCYSVPMVLNLPDSRKLTIRRILAMHQKKGFDSGPKLWRRNNGDIELAYLVLNQPRSLGSAFRAYKHVLRECDIPSLDGLWELINQVNGNRLWTAHNELRDHGNDLGKSTMYQAIEHQISSLFSLE